MNAGVTQGFGQRLVGFGQIDIFPDHADRDFILRMFQRIYQFVPHRQIGRPRRQAELFTNDRIESLVMQHLRNLVDRIGIPHGNDGVLRHIGEQRNLGPLVIGNGTIGAA